MCADLQGGIVLARSKQGLLQGSHLQPHLLLQVGRHLVMCSLQDTLIASVAMDLVIDLTTREQPGQEASGQACRLSIIEAGAPC